MKKLGTIIDVRNRKLFLCGPGGYEIKLSPGSEAYDLEESEMGHLMLPCSQFQAGKQSMNTEPIVFAVGADYETANAGTPTGSPQGLAGTEYYDVAANEVPTDEYDPLYDESFGWPEYRAKSSPKGVKERMNALMGCSHRAARPFPH